MMHLRAVGPRYLFVCFEGTCRLGYQKEDRDTGNVCCCYLHPETCHILFLCATKPSGEKSRLWFGRCLKKKDKTSLRHQRFPFLLAVSISSPSAAPLSSRLHTSFHYYSSSRQTSIISYFQRRGGGIASDNTKYIEIYICTILRSRMSPE